MLVGFDLAGLKSITAGQRWQALVIVALCIVVTPLAVDFDKAVEFQDRAIGAKPVGLAVAAFGFDLGRGAFELRVCHLAGNGALPDQPVEQGLVLAEEFRNIVRVAGETGGAHRLMGFLRVFRLGLIVARLLRQIAVAEFLADFAACLCDGLGNDLHAVRSHIGDEAHGFAADIDPLIELLGGVHGLPGIEAQLARGLLL